MQNWRDNVSFSFDDGHPADFFNADLLEKRGFKNAIFYVPLSNCEGRPVIGRGEIAALSGRFEIGCHTMTHRDLTTLPKDEAEREIVDSKKALEDIVGKPVTSFCPPRGHYDAGIVGAARSAGFSDFHSARLFNANASARGQGFVWHPNLHLYPHPLAVDLAHCAKWLDAKGLAFRAVRPLARRAELAAGVLLRTGHVHLWGHSWETGPDALAEFLDDLTASLTR